MSTDGIDIISTISIKPEYKNGYVNSGMTRDNESDITSLVKKITETC